MAKVRINALTSHLRGKIGNIVYKQYGDKTVATKAPVFKKNRRISVAEKKRRARFAVANAYAMVVLADPKRVADYAPWAKRGQLDGVRPLHVNAAGRCSAYDGDFRGGGALTCNGLTLSG